jgi:hypothetical protein
MTVVQPGRDPLQSVRLRDDLWLPLTGAAALPVAAGSSEVRRADVLSEGSDAVVLQNALVRVVIAPDAGARAFSFEDLSDGSNVFTTVGGLRDDVTIQQPVSATDYIAKYTHDFPAGMFNRPYSVTVRSSGASAGVTFAYRAPDVLPHGATFERTVTLMPDVRYFTVDERVTFPDAPKDGNQRAVSVTSLGSGKRGETAHVLSPGGSGVPPNAIAAFFPESKRVATIAWHAGAVESVPPNDKEKTDFSLVLAPGAVHLLFASVPAADEATAAASAARFAAIAQGPTPTPANSPH